MDLYAIRVSKKEKEKIRLKVFVTYEDGTGENLPIDDPHFFLEVLVEQLGPMNRKPEQLPPLAQEVLKAKPSKSASVGETMDRFLEKNGRQRPPLYISEVIVLEENVVEPDPDAITTWGFDERSGQFLEDESKISWVLFEVTLTDERWAAHLKEGQLFGTASYFK